MGREGAQRPAFSKSLCRVRASKDDKNPSGITIFYRLIWQKISGCLRASWMEVTWRGEGFSSLLLSTNIHYTALFNSQSRFNILDFTYYSIRISQLQQASHIRHVTWRAVSSSPFGPAGCLPPPPPPAPLSLCAGPWCPAPKWCLLHLCPGHAQLSQTEVDKQQEWDRGE